MATHSSILAWRIPWTEKLGGLQSMGSQRVRQDRVTNTHNHLKELCGQEVRQALVPALVCVPTQPLADLTPLSASLPFCDMGCRVLVRVQPGHCRHSFISPSFTVMQTTPLPGYSSQACSLESWSLTSTTQQRNTSSNECSSRPKGTKTHLGITKQSVVPWARDAFPAASTER